MTFIYHIATAADWERAVRDGQYTMSTRGLTLAEQGFIHASTADQVALVANAFYQGEPDLLLLVIDTDLVGPQIRYEHVPGQASPYPHIYGPLNLDAVVETRPFGSRPRRPVLLRWREMTGATLMKEVRARRGGSRAGAGAGSPPPFPGLPCA